MSPTEAKKMMDARRQFILDTAVQDFLDLEKGWKDHGAAYLKDCIEWVVEKGAHGPGPRVPRDLNGWLARAIREMALEAETVSRMGRRGK